jgi:hypothetical protein
LGPPDGQSEGQVLAHDICQKISTLEALAPIGHVHELDPDLAAVVAAWDRLPEAVKAGIVAMVRAASK